MNGIEWNQSSHFNLPDLWFFTVLPNLHESSLSFTIQKSDGSPWNLGFGGNFGSTFRAFPQAVQPIARQIMEGVQQLHDFGIVLASEVKISCCCGILITEKLEKWIRSG